MKCDMQNEERNLRDAGLTALLRETYADDPALMESPGRSERIMRKILTACVQPKRVFRWAPFAWAAGAVATAGVAVALALGGFHLGDGTNKGPVVELPKNKVVTPDVVKDEKAPTPVPVRAPEYAVNPPDVPPTPAPEVKRPQPAPRTPQAPRTKVPAPAPVQAPIEVATKPEQSPVQIASALYTAGDAAQAAGDYESAYQAYDAAYQMNPTPDALLASAEALLAIGKATLDSEG